MDGKILLFIRDYQLKRQVINLVAQLGLVFIECNDFNELDFRINLIDADKKLFFYEFHEGIEEEKQFKKLSDMKIKGWKTLVVFSKYFIPYIDKSHKAGINDLCIHPVEIASIKNKILTLLSIPSEIQFEQEADEVTIPVEETISRELNRATRGNYALSFVIFEFVSVVASKHGVFIEELKAKLRETDAIITGRIKDTYLIICPFTPKNFVVEVENKIRTLFEDKKSLGEIAPLSRVYAYGLTFGEDGDNFEELITLLESNLQELKKMDQTIKQSLFYNPEKLKVYRNIYRM
jgi:hypothetical protein